MSDGTDISEGAAGTVAGGETALQGDAKAPKARIKLGMNYWKLWIASVSSNLGDGVAQIAYPWLASAVTRNPMLIALIAVAQRIPWLVFTLPAGVITDRVDRRKIMVLMDVFRLLLTVFVAVSVVIAGDSLPAPGDIDVGAVVATQSGMYLVLLFSALLFGFAEVLRDNAAQTILPALVEADGLEKANGNLWSAELVANSFVGPPVGSLLLGIAFAFPFFFDAGTFAVSAGLVFLLTGEFRSHQGDEPQGKIEWREEIKEGFLWLWRHPLLKSMAIILGLINGLFMVSFATFVLFAQEVLKVSAFSFAILMTGGAIGGVLGGVLASRVSAKLGSGPSLYITLVTGSATALIIGISSWWPVAWAMFVLGTFTAVLWNVITVSLRQTIIPDRLLGRVNSVYRFFGWGMMPIRLAVGGLLVSGSETVASRELALRIPWFVTAAIYAVVFVYAIPKLTTEKIETARVEGIAAKEREQGEAASAPAAVIDDAIAEAGVAGAPPPFEDEAPADD